MKRLFLIVILACASIAAMAQTVTLTFTGCDAKDQHVQLNRVVITNLTQNWQETIYYPDTILMVGSTGINDVDNTNGFKLSQNVPNPFDGTTDFALQLPEAGKVTLTIYDLSGKKITAYQGKLAAGVHTFRVLLNTTQSYMLTARCGKETASIKMINNGTSGENAIRHIGDGRTSSLSALLKSDTKGATDKPFAFGDEMGYIGFALIDGTEYASQTIEKKQLVSETIKFRFTMGARLPVVITNDVADITTISASCGYTVVDMGTYVTARGVCWSTSPNPTIEDAHTNDGVLDGTYASQMTNLQESTVYYVRAYASNSDGTAYGEEKVFSTGGGKPCVGTPTVTDYDGNVYNTVQIGEQCWMKENLKTTRYADGTSIAQGSTKSYDVAYWYYPANNSLYKSTYGLLYNWKAVMCNSSSSSANPSGVQGICPNGWHVPSDAEWTQLTNYVSGLSEYQCNSTSRNIAKALASTTGWNTSTNTYNNCTVGNSPNLNNATGFSTVPAGYYGGDYNILGNYAFFWCATEYRSDNAYNRGLYYDGSGVGWYNEDGKNLGFSVRCLRD